MSCMLLSEGGGQTEGTPVYMFAEWPDLAWQAVVKVGWGLNIDHSASAPESRSWSWNWNFCRFFSLQKRENFVDYKSKYLRVWVRDVNFEC